MTTFTLPRTRGTWRAAPFDRQTADWLRLAAPMTLVALVNMAMSVTDTLMAAQFGIAALAAVAVGSDFYSIVFTFAAGAMAGLAPLYAAASAAGNAARLRRLRAAGWMLVALLAVGLAPLAWFAPDLLRAVGIPRELLETGRGYTQAMALTLVPMLAVAVLRNRLVALEWPGAILRVTACAIPLNAALNYVLMRGIGSWPGMGVTGAGYSSLIVACFIAATLGLLCARHGDRGVDWRAWADLAETLRLGLPIGFAMLAELGVFLGATLFAARFGPEAAAAHALTLRLAGIAYTISIGLQQAATVRTARLAGDPGQYASLATGIRLGAMAGTGILIALVLLAWPLPHAVLADPATVATATGLILLFAVSEAVAPLGAVAAGILRGFRDTSAPMLFTLLGSWGVTVPLALLLTAGSGLGVTGLWLALTAGSLLTTALLLCRLQRHRHAAARCGASVKAGTVAPLPSAPGFRGDGIASRSRTRALPVRNN